MELTKEMFTKVEVEIEKFDDNELLMYHNTYRALHKQYPNSYFKHMTDRSMQELQKRGLEP